MQGAAEYMSRSQLNRGLGRFAALGTAVEERERVLELEEALKQKTDDFEQRNILLIRSKDALQELGKRCSEAQATAEQRAAELIAVESALEEAQKDLDSEKKTYTEIIASMTTQMKSLEQEIVILHQNDEEHKEFASKLADAEKAREASEANLLILRAEKTETENKLLMEIQQLENKNKSLKAELEDAKCYICQLKTSQANKGDSTVNITQTADKDDHDIAISRSKIEAVDLALELNEASEQSRERDMLLENGIQNLRDLLDQEKFETKQLKLQVEAERQLRQNLCQRFELMELEIQTQEHARNEVATKPQLGRILPESNLATQKVTPPADMNDGHSKESTSKKPEPKKKKKKKKLVRVVENVENVQRNSNASSFIGSQQQTSNNHCKKKAATMGLKKKTKHALGTRRRKQEESIKLHIPAKTARVLLAYRENLF